MNSIELVDNIESLETMRGPWDILRSTNETETLSCREFVNEVLSTPMWLI